MTNAMGPPGNRWLFCSLALSRFWTDGKYFYNISPDDQGLIKIKEVAGFLLDTIGRKKYRLPDNI